MRATSAEQQLGLVIHHQASALRLSPQAYSGAAVEASQ